MKRDEFLQTWQPRVDDEYVPEPMAEDLDSLLLAERERLLQAIWKDLSGRAGFDYIIDDIDEDTRDEILARWRKL